MEENSRFHPAVETAIQYLGNPGVSMQVLADRLGISKQAVAKRVNVGEAFLKTFGQPSADSGRVKTLEQENQRLQDIIRGLRLKMIVTSVQMYLLACLKERIQEFFPRFRLSRFLPHQKKHLLDMAAKFQRAGGTLREFCKAIGKSHETLARWQARFDKYGLGGLADKTTRPHHFANKIPAWLVGQLQILYTRFPNWTAYQYHKYITHNPALHWRISLPTIAKIMDTFRRRSAAERDRIKKRWCFAPGTAAWTVDFTTILKTGRFRLQLLTVSDHRSRFLLGTSLFLDTSTAQVMDYLQDLFIKYGKPFLIKADGGPEFRLEFRAGLEGLAVYLLTNPPDYGQFNGAHERIHRELKAFISKYSLHRNLTRLVEEITAFTEQHNHYWPYDCLGNRAPAEVFFSDPDFVPKEVEVIRPYKKDGELRMKFTNRAGNPARMAVPLLDHEISAG